MQTPEPSTPVRCRISTLFAEDFPAKVFRSLENGGDLPTTQEGLCFLKLPVLPPLKDLHFCCLKMFPDSYLMTAAGRLRPSSLRWMTWGTMSRGKCLTAKILESPSRERECILSDILESDVPERYFLSQTQMGQLLSKSYQDQKDGGCTPPPAGVSITLTSSAGGFGGKTGLYDVTLPIKVMTKAGYQLARPGDSIDLAYATMNTRRGRVGDKIAHTVTPGNNQGYFFIDLNEDPSLTENARCLLANQDTGIGKFKGGRSGVFVENPKAPFAVPVRDADGNIHYGKVRKLMPIECWRLQGFSDEQFRKAASTGLSDAQLYKMAGNAVTVPVISALGEKIKEIWREQCQTM